MEESQFPEGHLNLTGEGAIQIAIGIQDGNVIIQFPKPVAWLGLPADQAMEMGRVLIRRGKEAIELAKH
jgi:hypothetical protein